MRFHPQNNWFHGAEFLRAAEAVAMAAGSLSFMTASGAPGFRAKYVQMYVDQRTGSFVFRDAEGRLLTHDEVYAMYPSLVGDGESARDPVDV